MGGSTAATVEKTEQELDSGYEGWKSVPVELPVVAPVELPAEMSPTVPPAEMDGDHGFNGRKPGEIQSDETGK